MFSGVLVVVFALLSIENSASKKRWSYALARLALFAFALASQEPKWKSTTPINERLTVKPTRSQWGP